jgi:hypothetical protein
MSEMALLAPRAIALPASRALRVLTPRKFVLSAHSHNASPMLEGADRFMVGAESNFQE